MTDPYTFPSAKDTKPPRVTLMTLIAVVFIAFMVYQVGTTIGESNAVLEQNTVQIGDTVEYDFTARTPDGRLWDTSLLDVAQAANETHDYSMNAPFDYVPKRAIIGAGGLGWGPTTDLELLGKRVGQTVSFTVSGAEGTGEWTSFTPNAPGIGRTLFAQAFDLVLFLQEPAHAANEGRSGTPGFNITALETELGATFVDGYVFHQERAFPPSWPIVFEEVNRANGSIVVRHDLEHEQSFQVAKLPGSMVALIDPESSTLAWRMDLTEGATFVVAPNDHLFGAGFAPGSYLVDAVTDDYVTLLHHPSTDPSLIGQPLHVEVIIQGIVRDDAAPAPQ